MEFVKAVDFVLEREGGLVDHPSDPGGLTNFGISQRAYPDVDIRNLTRDGASEIYRRDYWEKVSANQLPANIRLAVFDSAVNQGVTRAKKLLQKTLRITQDGIIGPKTIKASQEYGSNLLPDYLAERSLHYASLSTFETFGRGWMRRLFHVSNYRS